MLDLETILQVGRMMDQCGEGPLVTEGREPASVLQPLERIRSEEQGIQLRLCHILDKETGDVRIKNVPDDAEYEKLKAANLLAY